MRQLDRIRVDVNLIEGEKELGGIHRAQLPSGASIDKFQSEFCAQFVKREVVSCPPELLAEVD